MGHFAILVLLALCISVYSSSSIRAGVNAFAFFVGMLTAYYLYSNYIAGFFPKSYAMLRFGIGSLFDWVYCFEAGYTEEFSSHGNT